MSLLMLPSAAGANPSQSIKIEGEVESSGEGNSIDPEHLPMIVGHHVSKCCICIACSTKQPDEIPQLRLRYILTDEKRDCAAGLLPSHDFAKLLAMTKKVKELRLCNACYQMILKKINQSVRTTGIKRGNAAGVSSM